MSQIFYAYRSRSTKERIMIWLSFIFIFEHNDQYSLFFLILFYVNLFLCLHTYAWTCIYTSIYWMYKYIYMSIYAYIYTRICRYINNMFIFISNQIWIRIFVNRYIPTYLKKLLNLQKLNFFWSISSWQNTYLLSLL
jgi:hypothetical protein